VKKFQPVFDIDDLQRVPNFNTVAQTILGGVPSQPFSMATLPPLGNPNKKLAEALKQLSAAKYGRQRAGVEKEIFARLATKEEPKPSAVGMPQPTSTQTQQPARPVAPAKTGSSFLDDWLAKRKVPSKAPVSQGGFSDPVQPRSETIQPPKAPSTVPVPPSQNESMPMPQAPQLPVTKPKNTATEGELVIQNKSRSEQMPAPHEPLPAGDTISIDPSGNVIQKDQTN
jgi:hypothetical protein